MFLRANFGCFVWSHSDMTCFSLEVITQPSHAYIQQNKSKQGSFWNQVIEEKISKLLKIGSTREVKYPGWQPILSSYQKRMAVASMFKLY